LLERSLHLPARRYHVAHTKLRRSIWLLVFRLLLAVCLPTMAILEVLSSFSASLWLAALGLVFGTLQVIIPRLQNLPFTAAQEQGWGFGQLVPLILLVLPLGAIAEDLWPDPREEPEAPEKARIRNKWPSFDGSMVPPLTTVAPVHKTSSLPHGLPSRTFLGSLAGPVAQQPPAPLSSQPLADRHSELRAYLYRSKLFAGLVWLTQFAILVTAVVIFYFDSQIIGNTRANNWQFVIVAMCGFVGLAGGVTLLCAPYSLLGRADQYGRDART